MKKLLISIVFVLSLCLSGCTRETNTETGETKWKLNPIISEQFEKGGEGAAGLLAAIAPFWPPAGAASVTLLSLLGIYRRKVKPKFEKAKNEAEIYHASTQTLVEVIEDIKLHEPELWEKLKPLIKMGPNTENVIRALRGKPPIE